MRALAIEYLPPQRFALISSSVCAHGTVAATLAWHNHRQLLAAARSLLRYDCTCEGAPNCTGRVGVQNLTEFFGKHSCQSGDPDWECWHDATCHKTGGMWYSTTDDGCVVHSHQTLLVAWSDTGCVGVNVFACCSSLRMVGKSLPPRNVWVCSYCHCVSAHCWPLTTIARARHQVLRGWHDTSPC